MSPIKNNCWRGGIFKKRKCIHSKPAQACLRSNSIILLFNHIIGQKDIECIQKLGQIDKKKMLERLKFINFIGDIKHRREIRMIEKTKIKQVLLKSIDFYSLTTNQRSNRRRRKIRKAIKWIAGEKKIHFI